MLVIIDMQPKFGPQVGRAVAGVSAAVKQARRNGETIVVVEYEHWGPTHHKIEALLKGYPNVVRIFKDQNDASDAMLEAGLLSKKNLVKYKCVGVNTCYCVGDTVLGLKAAQCPKVTTIEEACACSCDDREWITNPQERHACVHQRSTCPAPKLQGVKS